MARITTLDELEQIDVAGVHWRPLRRALGISAFGINAYSADAGEHLIEEHDEAGPGGAGGHEELYLVVRGHATFTVGGKEVDAPAGTLVFLDEPAEMRSATAKEDGTMAVAIGGTPGQAGPPSPWEFFFAASPAAAAGDYERAYAITAEGLEHHPDNAGVHYNLACFAARAGRKAEAFDHLERAFNDHPKAREWAAKDADFDGVRDDPGWPG
jgi:tetratricopeptide (TPR) repeat protein